MSVQRPGTSRSAYLYSSSELLSGPSKPGVTVSYRLFDPEGKDGDPPKHIHLLFSYSLDGGDNWLPATPMAGQSDAITATLTRTGKDFTYAWNAVADKAIGENAAFRVEMVTPNGGPSVQQAVGAATSPPFQVRATTCIWPKDPRVFVNRQPALTTGSYPLGAGSRFAELTFDGTLAQGSGIMTFTWTIDDNASGRNGQRIIQRLGNGTYDVGLRAIGKPCPETRPVITNATVIVGTGRPDYFLPLVNKAPAAAAALVAESVAAGNERVYLPTVVAAPELAATDEPAIVVAAEAPAIGVPPPAVMGLNGEEVDGRVTLTWQRPPPGGAYEVRILRWPLDDPEARTVESTLPPMVGSYTAAVGCGVAYGIAPANDAGEAEIGNVYMLQPCGQEVK